jgi:hypothetical protein
VAKNQSGINILLFGLGLLTIVLAIVCCWGFEYWIISQTPPTEVNRLKTENILDDIEAFDFVPDMSGLIILKEFNKKDPLSTYLQILFYDFTTGTISNMLQRDAQDPIMLVTKDSRLILCPDYYEPCYNYSIVGDKLVLIGQINKEKYGIFPKITDIQFKNPEIVDEEYFSSAGFGGFGNLPFTFTLKSVNLTIDTKKEAGFDSPKFESVITWDGYTYKTMTFTQSSMSGYFIGLDGNLYLSMEYTLTKFYK